MKSLSKILLLLTVFLITTQQGHAQAEIGRRSRQLKDVSVARNLALKNTAVPVVMGFASNYFFKNNTLETLGASLIIYGLILGPSSGNFYAEDYIRGGLGMAARIGAGYLLKNATREVLGKNVAKSLTWDDKKVSIGDTEVLVGAGLFLGSMIYNIVSAKASVERYNRKMGYNIRLNPNIRNGQYIPMISATLHF